jgi:hypothetical protein
VIQRPDRVEADACNEWLDYVLAHEEPTVDVLPAAIRYFPQREPLASAGAPQRELLQRARRAAAS